MSKNLPDDDIEFPDEVRVWLIILLGEEGMQASSKQAYSSSIPFEEYAQRLLELRNRINDSISMVSGALPPRVAENYKAAMSQLVGGSLDLVTQFSDELRKRRGNQTQRSQDIAESKIEMIWEIFQLIMELALLAAMSYFTGGLSLSEMALAKARTRLQLLYVIYRALQNSHLLPGFSEALQEMFTAFAARLTMLAAYKGDRNPGGFDGGKLGEAAFFGFVAGGFISGLHGILDSNVVKNIFKNTFDNWNDNKWGNFGKNAFDSFASEGVGEAGAETVVNGILRGAWSFDPSTIWMAGVSAVSEMLISGPLDKGAKFLNNKFLDGRNMFAPMFNLPPDINSLLGVGGGNRNSGTTSPRPETGSAFSPNSSDGLGPDLTSPTATGPDLSVAPPATVTPPAPAPLTTPTSTTTTSTTTTGTPAPETATASPSPSVTNPPAPNSPTVGGPATTDTTANTSVTGGASPVTGIPGSGTTSYPSSVTSTGSYPDSDVESLAGTDPFSDTVSDAGTDVTDLTDPGDGTGIPDLATTPNPLTGADGVTGLPKTAPQSGTTLLPDATSLPDTTLLPDDASVPGLAPQPTATGAGGPAAANPATGTPSPSGAPQRTGADAFGDTTRTTPLPDQAADRPEEQRADEVSGQSSEQPSDHAQADQNPSDQNQSGQNQSDPARSTPPDSVTGAQPRPTAGTPLPQGAEAPATGPASPVPTVDGGPDASDALDTADLTADQDAARSDASDTTAPPAVAAEETAGPVPLQPPPTDTSAHTPVRPEQWRSQQPYSPATPIHTEIPAPAADGQGPAATPTAQPAPDTVVRTVVQRIQADDGRWVRTLTLDLPVRPGDGFSADRLPPLQEQMRGLLDGYANDGLRLPSSGDQLHIDLNLVHDPSNAEAIELTEVMADTPATSGQFHIQLVSDDPALGTAERERRRTRNDATALRQILRFAGVDLGGTPDALPGAALPPQHLRTIEDLTDSAQSAPPAPDDATLAAPAPTVTTTSGDPAAVLPTPPARRPGPMPRKTDPLGAQAVEPANPRPAEPPATQQAERPLLREPVPATASATRSYDPSGAFDQEFADVVAEFPVVFDDGRVTVWGQGQDDQDLHVFVAEIPGLGLRGIYNPDGPSAGRVSDQQGRLFSDGPAWDWYLPGRGLVASSRVADFQRRSDNPEAGPVPVVPPATERVSATPPVDPAVVAASPETPVNGPLPDALWRSGNQPLYKFSRRAPATVFREGLPAKGSDLVPLIDHVYDYGQVGSRSGYLSTTTNPNYVRDSVQADPLSAEALFSHYAWRYDIDAPGGIDVNATLGPASPFPDQQEIAFPGGVHSRFIRGVQPMRNGLPVGTYIPNPSYTPHATLLREPQGAQQTAEQDTEQTATSPQPADGSPATASPSTQAGPATASPLPSPTGPGPTAAAPLSSNDAKLAAGREVSALLHSTGHPVVLAGRARRTVQFHSPNTVGTVDFLLDGDPARLADTLNQAIARRFPDAPRPALRPDTDGRTLTGVIEGVEFTLADGAGVYTDTAVIDGFTVPSTLHSLADTAYELALAPDGHQREEDLFHLLKSTADPELGNGVSIDEIETLRGADYRRTAAPGAAPTLSARLLEVVSGFTDRPEARAALQTRWQERAASPSEPRRFDRGLDRLRADLAPFRTGGPAGPVVELARLLPTMTPDERTRELTLLGLRAPDQLERLASNRALADVLRRTLSASDFARAAAEMIVQLPAGVDRRWAARQEAQAQIRRMLRDPQVTADVLRKGYRVMVVPKSRALTSLSPFGHLAGREDTLRGVMENRTVGVGEENLLGETNSVPGARPALDSGYSSFTHEFAHAVHNALSQEDRRLIRRAYVAKLAQGAAGVWPDGRLYGTLPDGRRVTNYSSVSEYEYFAQLTNVYLGTNAGTDPRSGNQRNNDGVSWVAEHEPTLLPLLQRLYGTDPQALHPEPSNPIALNQQEDETWEGFRALWDQAAGIHIPQPHEPVPAPEDTPVPPTGDGGPATPSTHAAPPAPPPGPASPQPSAHTTAATGPGAAAAPQPPWLRAVTSDPSVTDETKLAVGRRFSDLMRGIGHRAVLSGPARNRVQFDNPRSFDRMDFRTTGDPGHLVAGLNKAIAQWFPGAPRHALHAFTDPSGHTTLTGVIGGVAVTVTSGAVGYTGTDTVDGFTVPGVTDSLADTAAALGLSVTPEQREEGLFDLLWGLSYAPVDDALPAGRLEALRGQAYRAGRPAGSAPLLTVQLSELVSGPARESSVLQAYESAWLSLGAVPDDVRWLKDELATLDEALRDTDAVRSDPVRTLARQLPGMTADDRKQELARLSPADRERLASDHALVDALLDALPAPEFASTAAQLMLQTPAGVEQPVSARPVAQRQLVRMLHDPRAAATLLKKGTRTIVLSRSETLPSLPAFGDLAGGTSADGRTWEQVRGLSQSTGEVVVPEENLLGEFTTVPGTGPAQADGYSTLTHELAHAIHQFVLTPDQQKRIKDAYDARLARGDRAPWPDGPLYSRHKGRL
ncbi:scabin-related ADP-ribosyltransferase, partial [Streptomyces bluensis]|uniref:scabin-related ADP-ribosyltransferase n=1 Tax=Streptomyces bluensis TaxID=33897 RepID=UPI004032A192